MAPCQMLSNATRTDDYKKVLKPLLERRRRARINRCLDQMRDLMVEALCMEGDSAAKLEKADVLELAVRHLQKLRGQKSAAAAGRQASPQAGPQAGPQASPQAELDRYRAGFSAAATVVSRSLACTPGVDVQLGTRIMQHLGGSFRALDERRLCAPLSVQVPQLRTRVPCSSTPTAAWSAVSPADSCSSGYSSGGDSGLLTVAAADTADVMDATPHSGAQFSPLNLKLADEAMWRPW